LPRPEDTAHPFHAAKQFAREPHVPQKMIVEEIKMTPRQTGNFRERIIDPLRVKTATPAKNASL